MLILQEDGEIKAARQVITDATLSFKFSCSGRETTYKASRYVSATSGHWVRARTNELRQAASQTVKRDGEVARITRAESGCRSIDC